jgi:hypothetical protein
MIKPLIDTFCQLPYQIDYAQNQFKTAHYLHLRCLSADQHYDLCQVLRYLHTVGLKNNNSFNRYRNEVEKLVLWLWYQKSQTLTYINEAVLKEYMVFIQCPPTEWCSQSRVSRFSDTDDIRTYNPLWRPFTQSSHSYESRASVFTVLNHFCNYLIDKKIINTNPVKLLRKTDPILTSKIKPQTKPETPSSEKLLAAFSQWHDDIHRMRDLMLFYFVRYKHIQLQAFTLQNDGFIPLYCHLNIAEKVFYYYHQGQLKPVHLCPFGYKIAMQYVTLRGNIQNHVAPLLHKKRGDGAYEVRQLRRMLKSIENELNTYA